MQKKSSPTCKKSAAASQPDAVWCSAAAAAAKVHTATVHQRINPPVLRGRAKGFCRLNGQDTAGIRIGEIGELAASVFQDPRSQFFTVNSSNEVAFGLENHGLPQDKFRRRVDEAFRIFHLERLKDRNVYELSSGERQLISILSAWAMGTDIFLLDEPTANLDFAATQQLKEILLALKKQGKTLLLSEHRLYYLADIADEFWVMADGEIKGKYLPQRQRRSRRSGDKHFLCARSTLRRSPCGERAAAENRADGACRLRCPLYIRQEGRRYPLRCQLFRP